MIFFLIKVSHVERSRDFVDWNFYWWIISNIQIDNHFIAISIRRLRKLEFCKNHQVWRQVRHLKLKKVIRGHERSWWLMKGHYINQRLLTMSWIEFLRVWKWSKYFNFVSLGIDSSPSKLINAIIVFSWSDKSVAHWYISSWHLIWMSFQLESRSS